MKSVQHRSIGALIFYIKNKGPGCGSGVIVSKNLVLTAAHNIYDKDYDCENTDFKFYLGANGPT
jgi:V8-like Glu-specific endopeptidase